MLDAGLNYRCRFSQQAIDEFMKANWKNRSNWNRQDLWNGELIEYKLGTSSMTFLRNGRNSISVRIKATFGTYSIYFYINITFMPL